MKVTALAGTLALLLSSCAMQNNASNISTDLAFGPLNETAAQYQQLANTSDPNSQYQALILLARSHITAKDLPQAKSVLNQLNTLATTPLQQDEANIIAALIATEEYKLIEAANILDKVNTLTLPTQAAAYYHQLNSRVQSSLYKQTGSKDNLFKVFNSQKQLVNLVNNDYKKAILLDTIKNLEQLSPSDLALELEKANNEEDKGYFEYAIIDNSKNNGIKQQLFNEFADKYSGHPLNVLIDTTPNQTTTPLAENAVLPQIKSGDEIAVILPLSGRFMDIIGKPAQLGILAALKDRTEKVHVTFYDSNVMTMPDIIAKANQKGTDFILGAVLKPEVTDLIASGTSIPAIVCNKVDNIPTNMWYFDLSPDYEGALAAAKMLKDNRQGPVIFAPSNQKSQRTVNGYNQQWYKVKNTTVPVCAFNTVSDAASAVSSCAITGKDSAYITGSPMEAAAIKASLPETLPVYLTSSSNPGVNNSSIEMSLNGAMIGDSPWVLTDTPIKDSLFKVLPKANALVQKIFATAYDSVNIGFNLNNLYQNKSDVLHGLTGDIQINGHLIETAPLWIKANTQR